MWVHCVQDSLTSIYLAVNFSTVQRPNMKQVFFSVARNPVCFPADAGGESSTLFVGNLSFKVGEDELYEFFSSAGHTPESVRLIMNQEGRPKGYVHAVRLL